MFWLSHFEDASPSKMVLIEKAEVQQGLCFLLISGGNTDNSLDSNDTSLIVVFLLHPIQLEVYIKMLHLYSIVAF